MALRIGILAQSSSWYYRDLARAVQQRGGTSVRLDFAQLTAAIHDSTSTISGRASVSTEFSHLTASAGATTAKEQDAGEIDLADLSAVIVRTMPPGTLEQVVFRMNVLQRLEAAGVRVINSPRSLECAIDKYLTTARLQHAGLPVPATVVCESSEAACEAFAALGGDVVVKPVFGAEGRGIVRVSDPDLAFRTFRTIERTGSVLYLQQFIDHPGNDVRVLVLNGQVLGGMLRENPHDFRTNVSRRATATKYHPTETECALALAAAECVGAWVAGVDLLYDRQRRVHVIEVNGVPGWKAFARVNQLDVADRVLAELEESSGS